MKADVDSTNAINSSNERGRLHNRIANEIIVGPLSTSPSVMPLVPLPTSSSKAEYGSQHIYTIKELIVGAKFAIGRGFLSACGRTNDLGRGDTVI